MSALTEVTISLLQWGIDRFAKQTRSASPRLGQKVARFTATDEVLHVYCAKQILSRYVRTKTRTQTPIPCLGDADRVRLRESVNSREVCHSLTWHSSKSESALERFEPVAMVKL